MKRAEPECKVKKEILPLRLRSGLKALFAQNENGARQTVHLSEADLSILLEAFNKEFSHA